MSRLLRLKNDENGSVLIIVAVGIFFLMGMAGLAVDASVLYKTKEEMRKAANSAALSGVQDLPLNDDEIVKDTVKRIIGYNDESDCKLDPNIIDRGKSMVIVKLDKEVDTYFMKIFGMKSVPVSVTSKAVTGILGGAQDVLPIGISDGIQYVEGMTYDLDYTPGNGLKGNYGFLDFAKIYRKNDSGILVPVEDTNLSAKSKGADLLNYYLKNGFGSEIKCGDVINTKTGVNKNQVYTGVFPRVGDNVVILVYDKNDKPDFAGTSSPIHVTGFATFCIESVDEEKNLIKGNLVDKPHSGSIDNSAKDWGARGIKLVE